MDQEYKELMDLLGDAGMVEGMVAGQEWRAALLPIIQGYRERQGQILFAYVEEYASLIDTIVSTLGIDRVSLYTASATAYQVISQLYPHVKVYQEWPTEESFDHIVVGAAGIFQAPDEIAEDVANGLEQLKAYGTAHLFLPLSLVHEQFGVNNMVLQFLLNLDRVTAIREWTPLGVIEFELDPAPVKKTRVAIREIQGNSYRETSFIKLPLGVFAQMPVFTVAHYALSLQSVLMPGTKQSCTLWQEGLYTLDGRLPAPVRAGLAQAADVHYLSFTRTPIILTHTNTEGESVSTGRPSFEVTASLSMQAPTSSVYWMFPDQEVATLWKNYFDSAEGQEIASKIANLAVTDSGFGQLLGSCRRD
ncbi:MAG: hypothetical protein HUJ85_02165 [Veillonella sp.]|nr:hypothetical protein [Veillonella sp.]